MVTILIANITNKYSSISISECNENMDSILFDHHTCIAVGDTSSALDAFLTGLNVIVFLPSGELNTSPSAREWHSSQIDCQDASDGPIDVAGHDTQSRRIRKEEDSE